MAFDKESTDYSDHATIGSAEELDTYGVWVKSGPQDLTDGMTGAVDFDTDPDSDFGSGAIPFEDDFDENFGNLGVVGMGLADGLDDIEEDVDFGGPLAAPMDRDAEGPSTELIMKIADEITSIRSELNTLKKEFADIRSEGIPGGGHESPQGGFFGEGDDEPVALTGDEMNNFLTSADFSDEEASEDPQRSADEAALRELSEQNESAEDIAPLEEEPLEEDAQLEETLPVESPVTFDEDFETPSFDGLDLEESPETAEVAEDLSELEPLEPVEESDELRDLRLEGALPQTPAPDNTAYLESDPFALDSAALAEAPAETTIEEVTEETVTEETAETAIDEPAEAEEPLSLDTETDSPDESIADLTFEDSAFDLSLDDISGGEETVGETAAEEVAEPAPEEADSSVELSLDEPEPALDETELSLDEPVELSLDDEPALEEADSSVELSLDTEAAEPEAAEPALDDPGVSFDSDSLELSEAVLDDSAFSFDDTDSLEIAAEPEPALEEADSSVELSLDTESAEPEATEADVGEPAMEITDEQITEEQAFDVESLDLSTAVIDEPDLSADAIVEPPLEEPVLDDLDLKDDISLDMDNFGAIDLESDDNAVADSGQTSGIIDDSIPQVIPEGFEVNAAEASLDDELEAFTEEELTAPSADAESGVHGDMGIPVGLETELKRVLSYMDHLLESLPEDKIEEFAKSEYFDTYKKIFKELGLV